MTFGDADRQLYMCTTICIGIPLFIVGVFVFILGGYFGKYMYYLGHPVTDPSIDDVPWLWRHTSEFFAWDGLFIFWGFIFVLLYVLLLAAVWALFTGVKRGICCVVKAPYKGVKYLASGSSKKETPDTKKAKKKKTKKQKKKSADDEV